MLTHAAVNAPMAVESLGGGPVRKPKPLLPADPQNDMSVMDGRSAGPSIRPQSPVAAPSAGFVGDEAPRAGAAKPLAVPGEPLAPQPPNRPAKPPAAGAMPPITSLQVDAPSVGSAQASAGNFNVEAFRPFADATYSEATRQLDPMFRQREADFRQRMVNQGIAEGTEAFDNAFDNFSRERNDAFSSARNQALAQALGAQNQFFGQSFNNAQLAQQGQIANAQMGLQAQMANAGNMLNLLGLGENRRQFNANIGQRESEFGRTFGEGQRQFDSQFGFGRERADMQDLMSLLGYGQQTTNYNNSLLGIDQQRAGALFGLIPGLTPTQLDVMGAANMWNQQHMQGRQLQQDARNGTMQAIGQLGGAALMMSDARLKTDISRVGTLDNGLPVYRYRYKAGGPMHIGVMAQDVQQVRPEAVGEIGGFLAVDYAEATR